MNLKVLIVEDSVLFQRILAEVLESIPYVEVIGSAANGKIAVQKIYDLHPDLITLDMEMPEMGGRELAEQIKSLRKDTPVLLLSGWPIFL
ncbi:MAG: response regulator, partial [Deltaproteobacteria bacterium]|nr:response regulator [Deltaproteobacteria bacterium]